MGLRALPSAPTVSRMVTEMVAEGVEKVRDQSRSLVIGGLRHEVSPGLPRDFDGSVQSTEGHGEGTAVGFNKSKGGRAVTIRG